MRVDQLWSSSLCHLCDQGECKLVWFQSFFSDSKKNWNEYEVIPSDVVWFCLLVFSQKCFFLNDRYLFIALSLFFSCCLVFSSGLNGSQSLICALSPKVSVPYRWLYSTYTLRLSRLRDIPGPGQTSEKTLYFSLSHINVYIQRNI